LQFDLSVPCEPQLPSAILTKLFNTFYRELDLFTCPKHIFISVPRQSNSFLQLFVILLQILLLPCHMQTMLHVATQHSSLVSPFPYDTYRSLLMTTKYAQFITFIIQYYELQFTGDSRNANRFFFCRIVRSAFLVWYAVGGHRRSQSLQWKWLRSVVFNHVYLVIHGGMCAQAVVVSVALSFC
jgi:hypothetical protein